MKASTKSTLRNWAIFIVVLTFAFYLFSVFITRHYERLYGL